MQGNAGGFARHLREIGFENPHVAALEAAWGRTLDGAEAVAGDRLNYLFLLFTNRCGSNYLAQVLLSTGMFNGAGEFFNADTVLEHARAQKLGSFGAYFEFVGGLVQNRGWVAAKLGVEHLDLLVRSGVMQRVLERSSFVLLERRDRLAQAISRAIAAQDLAWTSLHPRRLPASALVYDRAAIEGELERIALGNGLLHRFVEAAGRPVLQAYYEALVDRPQGLLDRLGAMIGVSPLVHDPAAVGIERQGGAVNAAWRARFVAGG